MAVLIKSLILVLCLTVCFARPRNPRLKATTAAAQTEIQATGEIQVVGGENQNTAASEAKPPTGPQPPTPTAGTDQLPSGIVISPPSSGPPSSPVSRNGPDAAPPGTQIATESHGNAEPEAKTAAAAAAPVTIQQTEEQQQPSTPANAQTSEQPSDPSALGPPQQAPRQGHAAPSSGQTAHPPMPDQSPNDRQVIQQPQATVKHIVPDQPQPGGQSPPAAPVPSTGLEEKAIPPNVGGIPTENVGIQSQNPTAFQPTNGGHIHTPSLAPQQTPDQPPGKWEQNGFVRRPLTVQDLQRLSQPIPTQPGQQNPQPATPKQPSPQQPQEPGLQAPAQQPNPGNTPIDEIEKQRGAALIPTAPTIDNQGQGIQGQQPPPPQTPPPQNPQEPPQQIPPNNPQAPQQPQPGIPNNTNTISEENRSIKPATPRPKQPRPQPPISPTVDQQQQQQLQ